MAAISVTHTDVARQTPAPMRLAIQLGAVDALGLDDLCQRRLNHGADRRPFGNATWKEWFAGMGVVCEAVFMCLQKWMKMSPAHYYTTCCCKLAGPETCRAQLRPSAREFTFPDCIQLTPTMRSLLSYEPPCYRLVARARDLPNLHLWSVDDARRCMRRGIQAMAAASRECSARMIGSQIFSG